MCRICHTLSSDDLYVVQKMVITPGSVNHFATHVLATYFCHNVTSGEILHYTKREKRPFLQAHGDLILATLMTRKTPQAHLYFLYCCAVLCEVTGGHFAHYAVHHAEDMLLCEKTRTDCALVDPAIWHYVETHQPCVSRPVSPCELDME